MLNPLIKKLDFDPVRSLAILYGVQTKVKKIISDSKKIFIFFSGGKWAIEPLLKDALEGDNGLVLKNKAAHHALAKEFDEPWVFDKDLVVQYEVGFQSGIECGGAYMKESVYKNCKR